MTSRWTKPAWAAGLIAYFFYFSWDVVRVRFAPDDLMNLDYYWRLKPWELLLFFFEPWSGGYRPMGGVFYLPLLRLFGLNPAPYHVAMLAIVLANVWLIYRFARVLGCSEIVAAVAAMLACYHAGLSLLYYNIAFIYDVLCCFFYLAAFVYYAGIRASGRSLTGLQMAVALALHYCALNSKEMAVTLPVVVLAYEWTYHKRPSLRAPILMALLNLPLMYALFLRPNSLAVQNAMYRPEISVARVMAFQRDSFKDLFEAWQFFTVPWVLVVWAVITFLAWRRRDPVFRFCWCFILITPIPLEMLVGRVGACLAIPFCGLAVFAAKVFVDAAAGLANRARAPRLRQAVFASLIAVGVSLWAVQNARLKQSMIAPQMADLGQDTWAMISQLHALQPRIHPHSTVVFLNDPFEDFDMAFIAELSFRQPGLNIRLQRKTPLPPEELAKADHLFAYEQGKLSQIR